ncbi:MAG: hypothetical protein GY770_01365 [Aestuariibacter sp.]|nr:hypothetical protein [Aestuariibacter sp.]
MTYLARLITLLLLLTAFAVSSPAMAKLASGMSPENFTVSEQLSSGNCLFLIEKAASNTMNVSGKLFTQMDSWMGNNSDPITLHKYLYGNVDPVNMVDPSGKFSIGSLGSAINVAGTLAARAQTIFTGFQIASGGQHPWDTHSENL